MEANFASEMYYVCVQVTQSEIYEPKLHTVRWFASSRRDQCGFTVIRLSNQLNLVQRL